MYLGLGLKMLCATIVVILNAAHGHMPKAEPCKSLSLCSLCGCLFYASISIFAYTLHN